jgi:hypothetical protein
MATNNENMKIGALIGIGVGMCLGAGLGAMLDHPGGRALLASVFGWVLEKLPDGKSLVEQLKAAPTA